MIYGKFYGREGGKKGREEVFLGFQILSVLQWEIVDKYRGKSWVIVLYSSKSVEKIAIITVNLYFP